MNRFFWLFLCLILANSLLAQEDYIEEQKKLNKFEKKKNYQGPTDWYSEYPSDVSEEEETYIVPPKSIQQGIQYNPNTITRYRRDHNKLKRGQNGSQPKVEDEAEDEKELLKPPSSITPPNIKMNKSSWLGTFWKYLALILVILIALAILYFFLRKAKPLDKKITYDLEDDWNPEIITKTELELKLEASEANGEYRECIRILFTFILKDLIQRDLIDWQKDKTNHEYLMELENNELYDDFFRSVHIYELIWYGEYIIDGEIYNQVKQPLIQFYKKIEVINE